MFHRAAAFVVALVLLTACGSSTATAPPYENVTRGDTAFASQFRHEFADVDGVKMHYVTGGKGAPLVLLHGWPRTWYGWHRVMPALAEHFTVYALDLPGLGDSAGSPPGYDKATLARYVHGLVAGRLGLRDVRIAGHDLGAAVAFQYAAQFPGDLTKLAYLDLPLPGPALDATAYRNLSWHIAFHSQKTVPETVIGDDVREYLSLFYPQVAYKGTAFGGPGAPPPFDDAEIDEYARTYTRPEVLHGGFELYRALGQDAAANAGAKPITTPTLLMTAEGLLEPQKATLAPRVANLARAVEVPRAGHWLAEENPEFVSAELVAFLK